MTIHISREQARRFLTAYHLQQTDLAGVFTRLGTVQYDPLNPVGRNPDLVFQARVPGYRVDDWQPLAYTQRLIYDAWDKQACLVPCSDWPKRACVRAMYRPYHDREVLQAESTTVEAILAEIDARGPLSSQDFVDSHRYADNNTWYGLSRTKRVLRALWACGELLTHHRKKGRHYYDRPAHIIPPEYYDMPPLLDNDAYVRWIIAQRYRAVGLLRPNAEACVWSACGNSAAIRKQATAQLVMDGTLTPVLVGEKDWPYYICTSALPLLDADPLEPRVIFLGPLDNMLWDRKALLQLFNFDYIWEVYKPAPQRRWGYYVLPVFYGDHFIARLDSRLEKGVWTISNWWWEADIVPTVAMLDALSSAAALFLHYLNATDIYVDENVDSVARAALLAAIKLVA